MGTTAKLATFTAGGGMHYGLIKPGGAALLSPVFSSRFPSLREAIAAGALGELVEAGERRPADFSLADVRFQPPIPAPEKIICIGVNYPERNEEYRDGQAAKAFPSMFIRFPRSFTGHDQPLIRPKASQQLDYEAEVVIVIGKAGRHIAERDALSHVAALSLANEGTLRDWVRHAKFNVTQGKNFDSSGSMGPWIVPYADESQVADISIISRVNGETRQDDRTSRMIFSFRYLIAYISAFTTLVPGDVIITGTPAGAGARFDPPRYLQPGDVVEVEAGGIGILRNTIADES